MNTIAVQLVNTNSEWESISQTAFVEILQQSGLPYVVKRIDQYNDLIEVVGVKNIYILRVCKNDSRTIH